MPCAGVVSRREGQHGQIGGWAGSEGMLFLRHGMSFPDRTELCFCPNMGPPRPLVDDKPSSLLGTGLGVQVPLPFLLLCPV